MEAVIPFEVRYDFASAYKAFLKEEPTHPTAGLEIVHQAFDAASQSHLTDAADQFTFVVENKDYGWVDGYFYAGMCHLLDGNYAEAALSHSEALKGSENRHFSHYLYAGMALWVLGLKGRANTHWWHAYQVCRNEVTSAFINRFLTHEHHPERLALFPLCRGKGIDVGCGSRKTHPDAIGVDITTKGEKGIAGCEAQMISQADVTASGDNMYMFADESLDFVVQRHNLEHYQDPIKALQEWRRVLSKGGLLGMVIPDDEVCDTIKLDPTHKHVFTQSSLLRIFDMLEGFRVVYIGPLLKDWSFVCVAQKVHKYMDPIFYYQFHIDEFEKGQVASQAELYLKLGYPQLAKQCHDFLDKSPHSKNNDQGRGAHFGPIDGVNDVTSFCHA
jgi:predicted SAM-dependent methyltransferase